MSSSVLSAYSTSFLGLGLEEDIVVYNYGKCVDILMEREGWSDEEVEEYMQYNVVCARFGGSTPGFVRSQ